MNCYSFHILSSSLQWHGHATKTKFPVKLAKTQDLYLGVLVVLI